MAGMVTGLAAIWRPLGEMLVSRGFIENLVAGGVILILQLAVLDVLISRVTTRFERQKWAGVRHAIFDRVRLSFLGAMSSYWRVNAISQALDFFVVEFGRLKGDVWEEKRKIFEATKKPEPPPRQQGFLDGLRGILKRKASEDEDSARDRAIEEIKIERELADRLSHEEIARHLEGLVPEGLNQANGYFFTDYDWYRQELQLLSSAIDSEVSSFISTNSNLLNSLQTKLAEGFEWIERFRKEGMASYYEFDPRFSTPVFMPQDIYLELRGVCEELDELFDELFANFRAFSKYVANQSLEIRGIEGRRAKRGLTIIPLRKKRKTRFRLTFEYSIPRGTQREWEKYYDCGDEELAREIRQGIAQVLRLRIFFRNLVEIMYFKRYELQSPSPAENDNKDGTEN